MTLFLHVTHNVSIIKHNKTNDINKTQKTK